MNTLFWKETWLGNVLLCEKYNRLFRLEESKNTLVSERIVKNGSTWNSSWNWIKEPTGRTGDEFRQLQTYLNSFSFKNNPKDSWEWKSHSSRVFTTHTFTSMLNESCLQNISLHPATMRNNLIPLKVGILIWRAKLKRLPVHFELDKRGVDLDSVMCPNYNNEVETVEHMMLTCPRIKDLWNRVFKWVNMNTFAYSCFDDMFNGTLQRPNAKPNSNVWQAIEWVTGYMIWRNRNLKVFENKEWNGPMTINEIQAKRFLWISSRSKKSKIDWNQWLLNPNIYEDHG
ncbi:uncharacterized protein [Rutidosis leptorrhynchoides]|uniref:uncharacterized protein n=1 Tax=Rutidosis leptorrhynchoides TaxID=125765 RepID=UPI003A99A196